MKRITIDPVTRIEDTRRSSFSWTDKGRVAGTEFHVTRCVGENSPRGVRFTRCPHHCAHIADLSSATAGFVQGLRRDPGGAARCAARREKLRELVHLRPDGGVPCLEFLLFVRRDLLLGMDSDMATRRASRDCDASRAWRRMASSCAVWTADIEGLPRKESIPRGSCPRRE